MSYTDFQEGALPASPEEQQQLQESGFQKCRNQLCNYHISPDVTESAYQADKGSYTCPHCGLDQDLLKSPGQPGGSTNSGLRMDQQAQIGEDLVQKMGTIPGYGNVIWWHKGGAATNSPFDGAVPNWLVEVKTVNWNTQRRRGIINTRDRGSKLRAVQNPDLWRAQMGDPELDAAFHQLGHIQGVLGILVLLDFEKGTADIFARPMPHDPTHQHGGIINFSQAGATQIGFDVPFESGLPDPRQEGFVPHSEGTLSSWKLGLDYMGPTGIGQTPEAEEDQNTNNWAFGQPPNIVGDETKNDPAEYQKEYNFYFGGGQLHVSADHEPDELQGHAQVSPDHVGPTASGKVTVINQKATWHVNTNLSLHTFSKLIKDYCKQVGWRWGGMTDLEGQPISDDFAPKKSRFGEVVDYIKEFGTDPHDMTVGPGVLLPKTAEYPGGGNMNDMMVKHYQDGGEDLELHNLGDINEPYEDKDKIPEGQYRCKFCLQKFPNGHEYEKHMAEEGRLPRSYPKEDGHAPEIGVDAVLPPRFQEQPNFYGSSWKLGKDPKDSFKSPIPFIYDIEKDSIHTGYPGQTHLDIKPQDPTQQFTHRGIVEGTYEPGGKVILRSTTDRPYTIYHLVSLWYNQHPHLEVTNVHRMDNQGKTKKVAYDPIQKVKQHVAMDPAVDMAQRALANAGGQVHVVGGAVRDAIRGEDPKDIDLMVTGLPADVTRRTLEALPGRVDLTGKDFGVFRYKHKGHEVEIALPRRERSTGATHQDFDVQADHTMTPEEDLARRDFTANAMAIPLNDHRVIDPFGGANDIRNGTLRVIGDQSFQDDPLRVVRALTANARHGLEPDDNTKLQMMQNAGGLEFLPKERIQMELQKIMQSKNPARAIQLAHETGVLKHIFPEVDQNWDYMQ